MMKFTCAFLCLCYVVGSYGNLAPFIDKCEWSDKACLVASTQKAIPFFAAGLPELGVETLDPLKMDKVVLDEGGLKVVLTNVKVSGLGKCKVLSVQRDIKKNLLKLEAECPIDAVGDYEASGQLLFTPIEGNGAFHVKTNKIFFSIEIGLTTKVGKDDKKYWKLGKAIYTYEVKEKATLDFENLFNGDKEKAAPVLTILNESSYEIMHSVGKPIMNEVILKIIGVVGDFCKKVPADELEK